MGKESGCNPMPDWTARLESLYHELPEVACRGCGFCCVSPTITLAEFIHHIDHARHALPAATLASRFAAPPELHPEHEGNLRCAWIDGSKCLVHAGRSASCRIFGVPSLANLGVSDLVQCKNGIAVTSGDGSAGFIAKWIERLFDINRALYAFDAEPYFIRGLNLECWLDIYFDATLDFDVFADIRRRMHEAADLREWARAYRPKTGIREKIDKISVLSAMMGMGDRETMRGLVLSIRDEYPFTGTWFLEEANAYLREMEKADKAV
jgi:hypothetical protein